MQKILSLLCLLCFLFFVSGCTNKSVVISSQPEKQSIVTRKIFVLGDSLSAGYQLPIEQSYPMVLESKLKNLGYQVQVINGGKSGDTSAGLKERYGRVTADAQSGDIALIVIGGNDGLQGLDIIKLEQNLFAIAQTLQRKGLRVIIGGMQLPVNMGEEYRRVFTQVYPRVAQQTKSTLIPFILSGVGGVPALNLPDGIHPNASGQVVVAETVKEFVLPLFMTGN